MRTELDWTYSEAGWMNTINAGGYLIGALLAAPLAHRFGLWRVLSAGLWLTVATIFATGATRNFAWLSIWRFLTGISGALCFVTGGAISATIATEEEENSGRVLALFYAGPGFGIALSGAFVPPLLDRFGSSAWPFAWVLPGVLACFPGAASMIAGTKNQSPPLPQTENHSRFKISRNVSVLLGYAAFGAGYICYMTFMFALLKQLGSTTLELSAFWVMIGSAAMASPWLWANVVSRMRHGNAIAFLIAVTLVGAAGPLISPSFVVAMISAATFGSPSLRSSPQ